MKTLPHSYSRISAALACPLSYQFYLARAARGIEAEILQVGSLVHLFAEKYAERCIAIKQPSDIGSVTALARACYESMRQEYQSRGEAFLGELAYEKALDTLIRPFAETRLFDHEHIAEIESRTAITRDLQVCAWDAPDAWFRARLDRLEFPELDTARIVDYKTGFNPEADPLQMEIYAWLVMLIYPHLTSVTCELDYVRFNVQKFRTFTRDQWPWLHERILGITTRVEAIEDFTPAPGLHCAYCDYRRDCTARAVVPGEVETLDEARQAIEAISLLSRDLDDAKERLRAYCVANGVVEHNGAAWGIHSQGGMGFDDAAEFIDACEGAGIDPKPYLTVNNTKTKSAKARKALAAVSHLLVNRASTVFKGKKIGGDE